MYSSVFEDNNGALQLARSPPMTPRTKHYAIKYHFFGYVEKEEIKLYKINTKEQCANIMTKGLVFYLFIYLQKFLCGWGRHKQSHKIIQQIIPTNIYCH
jgi:hypothetical protein